MRSFLVNIGRTRLRVSLGELSSHAKRELIMVDYHNPFYYKFSHDCAPYAADKICPTEACETTFLYNLL